MYISKVEKLNTEPILETMGNMISGLACSLNSGPSQACSLGGALNIRQLAVITSLKQNRTAIVY